MTEIERIIEEKKYLLSAHRATGRSCRLLNDIIEHFFQEPMGTIIYIRDHYNGANFGVYNGLPYMDTSHSKYFNDVGSKNADKMMVKSVRRRLDTEYPDVKYKIVEPNMLIRQSPTLAEKLNQEIEELSKIK